MSTLTHYSFNSLFQACKTLNHAKQSSPSTQGTTFLTNASKPTRSCVETPSFQMVTCSPRCSKRVASYLPWETEGVCTRMLLCLGQGGTCLFVTLLGMYSKCGDVGSAEQVFDEIPERDVFSWNSIMSSYMCNGISHKPVEMLGVMRRDGCGCEPDVVTWNTVMDAYCRMGKCWEASRVFREIEDPNVISWTILISGYAGVGRDDVSLGTFREMVNVGMVSPDVDALSGVLVSCRSLGALASGKEIHGYGLKVMCGDVFYRSAGAALLMLYAGCGRLGCAYNVFWRMDKRDVVTWNAMIFGMVEAGLGDLAIECFREMQGRGVRIDGRTISSILPVCDLRRGKEIHAYVRKHNFSFVIPVYNALIHIYSIRGCIAYAYSVFSTMLERDLVSWNTIIGGFGTHGLGQMALELLQEMIDSGVRPDLVTFLCALSACSHSGLVNQGIELFCIMTNDFNLIPARQHFSCVVDMLSRAGRLEHAIHFINHMPQEPNKLFGELYLLRADSIKMLALDSWLQKN